MFDDSIKIIIKKKLLFLFLVTSVSIVDENNVTSWEVELGGKMTLM